MGNGRPGGPAGAKAAAALRPDGRLVFAEPTVIRRGFDVVLTGERYATNLATQSAVKQLSAAARRELLSRVRRRVTALGDRLTVHDLVVTTIAQRR